MREEYPVIQLNKKTAFFAALFINLFFVGSIKFGVGNFVL